MVWRCVGDWWWVFFFSSGRRHTRCALVTGVQTCALPISISPQKFFPGPIAIIQAFIETWVGPAFFAAVLPSLARLGIGIVVSLLVGVVAGRSAERRVGKARVSTCKSRWSQQHKNKNNTPPELQHNNQLTTPPPPHH